jgi:XTP/dITP diphosphohydrolase
MLYWQKYITDRKRGKKMEELVIATHNPGKVEEFKTLMQDLHLTFKCLSDFPAVATPAETGRTFAANAKQKAIYYAKALNAYCLADDSGLEVKALDGAPGVHSARYAGEEASDKENNDLLLQNMKFEAIRTCRFRCALAVANPQGKIVAEADGICDGMLLHEPLGDQGFGYDPLFWSTELHKGMGEATPEEKNGISHRGKAIRKLMGMWKKIK